MRVVLYWPFIQWFGTFGDGDFAGWLTHRLKALPNFTMSQKWPKTRLKTQNKSTLKAFSRICNHLLSVNSQSTNFAQMSAWGSQLQVTRCVFVCLFHKMAMCDPMASGNTVLLSVIRRIAPCNSGRFHCVWNNWGFAKPHQHLEIKGTWPPNVSFETAWLAVKINRVQQLSNRWKRMGYPSINFGQWHSKKGWSFVLC